MREELDEQKKFIKLPLKGDFVKVYPNVKQAEPRYGNVIEVKKDSTEREIVVLEEVFECTIPLHEINFFLEQRYVEFKKQMK